MSKQVIRAEYENTSLLQNAVDYLCDSGIEHASIRVVSDGKSLANQIYDKNDLRFLGSASSLTSESLSFFPESTMRLYPIAGAIKTMSEKSMHPRTLEVHRTEEVMAPTIYIDAKKDSADKVYNLLKNTKASRITKLN